MKAIVETAIPEKGAAEAAAPAVHAGSESKLKGPDIRSEFAENLKRIGYKVSVELEPHGLPRYFLKVTAKTLEAKNKITTKTYFVKIFDTRSSFEDELKKHQLLSTAVKTPKMSYYNRKTLELAYEYIDGTYLDDMLKQEPFVSEGKLEIAMAQMGEAFKSIHSISQIRKDGGLEKKDVEHITKMAKEAYSKIKPVLDVKMPFWSDELLPFTEPLAEKLGKLPKILCHTHGDAHVRNFVFTENGVYVLDGERAHMRAPFCDLFDFFGDVYTRIMEGNNPQIKVTYGSKIGCINALETAFFKNYPVMTQLDYNLMKMQFLIVFENSQASPFIYIATEPFYLIESALFYLSSLEAH